jgi:hypothetical protein
MDDPNYQGMSAARRHAETVIRETLERRPKEQERNREALAAKTARLRELRLAPLSLTGSLGRFFCQIAR